MSNLPNLIWLGVVPVLLKVDLLLDSCLSEDMVTAADPHFEAQVVQQVAQVTKCNGRIRLTAQYFSD
jgi:propanediol dehydratase small subunit